MKNLNTIFFLLFFVIIKSTLQSQCVNGGLENSNLNNWTLYWGNAYNTPVNQMLVGNPGRISITDNQNPVQALRNDPIGGYLVATEGRYSVKIGDNSIQNTPTSTKTQMAGYTINVTAANANFKFKYAASFWTDIKTTQGRENAYNSGQQRLEPTFSWFMVAGNNPAGVNLPNKSNVFGATLTPQAFVYDGDDVNQQSFFHIPWTCVQYNLTPFIGQQVTIFFKTTNCNTGSHYCYAYIDGLCDDYIPTPSIALPNTACVNSNSPVLCDMTSSTKEESFILSIQECSQDGTILYDFPVGDLFANQQAGVIDIRNYYTVQKKMKFKCNAYYKIRLLLNNCFYTMIEGTKIIKMICPTVDAGIDKTICCNNLQSVQIGTQGLLGNTYSWSSVPVGFTSTLPIVNVNTNTSNTYVLVATESTLGCKATDTVDIFVNAPLSSSIVFNAIPNLNCGNANCNENKSYPVPASCGPTLTAVATIKYCGTKIESADWNKKKLSKLKYSWNTGETSQTIAVRSGVTNYSVTITDGCYSTTSTIKNVVSNDYFTKPISTMLTVNGCIPSDPKRWWKILDFNSDGTAPAEGTGPAYHAYRYKLKIWDRWGHVLRCIEVCDPNGFKNGDIVWDGKDDAGNVVPMGVYNYQLYFWNCSTPPDGQAWRTVTDLKFVCTKKKWWCFFMGGGCCKGYYEVITKTDYIEKITVIR